MRTNSIKSAAVKIYHTGQAGIRALVARTEKWWKDLTVQQQIWLLWPSLIGCFVLTLYCSRLSWRYSSRVAFSWEWQFYCSMLWAGAIMFAFSCYSCFSALRKRTFVSHPSSETAPGRLKYRLNQWLGAHFDPLAQARWLYVCRKYEPARIKVDALLMGEPENIAARELLQLIQRQENKPAAKQSAKRSVAETLIESALPNVAVHVAVVFGFVASVACIVYYVKMGIVRGWNTIVWQG